MTTPLANFSSLLEIAFGLSALSGFVQSKLVHRLEEYDAEIAELRTSYKEEKDDEIYNAIEDVRNRLSKGLHLTSDVIQVAILTLACTAITLLFVSAILPDFGYTDWLSILIVGAMIGVPILATAVFSLVLDVRHTRAIDALRSLMFDLEKKGLHIDGSISLSRFGKLFGIQIGSRGGGFVNWLVRKLAGYKTITIDFEEPDIERLNKMRRMTGQNTEEIIASSIGLVSSLIDNRDGFMIIKREDGWIKKVPVEKFLSMSGEGELDQFIESLPWEEPETDKTDPDETLD